MTPITKITNRPACLRALKKLGFEVMPFTMLPGTKMVTGYGVTFTVAPENFIATDKQHVFGLIPTCLHIANTAANTRAQHDMLVGLMVEAGLCEAGETLPILGLAVGIAHLAKLRAEGSIVVLTHDVVEA